MKYFTNIVWIRALAAFSIAFALWVYVDITTNPSASKTIDLTIEPDGLPSGIVMLNEQGLETTETPRVKVDVTGSQSTLQAIQPGVNLHAKIDCRGVGRGQQVLNVYITSGPELGYVKAVSRVKQVSMQFDTKTEKAVPITRIAENDFYDRTAFTPIVTVTSAEDGKIVFRGPSSKIETIKEGRYVYPITSQTNDGSRSNIVVQPYTAGGEIVTGVESNPKTISIRIAMQPASISKRVVVIPNITGVVAAGYHITNISVEPTTVLLTTAADMIDAVKEIQTEQIIVDGMTESVSQEYALVEPALGNGVTSKLGALRALVRITIEKHTEPIRVKLPVAVKIVDAPEGMVFRTEPSTVFLDVEIPAELQGALNTLEATVSVGAWDPASPARQIRVVKAKGLQILNKLPFVMLIPVTNAATEPTPTPEPPVAEGTPSPTIDPPAETEPTMTPTATSALASPTATSSSPQPTAIATATPTAVP